MFCIKPMVLYGPRLLLLGEVIDIALPSLLFDVIKECLLG